jgi:4-hydroxy-tetrahydrodipicolinate synthase
MTARISGTLAAAVTPLRDGGTRLDEPAIEPLLAFYRVAGLDGLLVCGTTGEGILLTDAERRRFAERDRGPASIPPAPATRSRSP